MATATTDQAPPSDTVQVQLGPASQELISNARRYADDKARAQIAIKTAGWAQKQAELEQKVAELEKQITSLSKASSRKSSSRSSGSLQSPSNHTQKQLNSSTSRPIAPLPGTGAPSLRSSVTFPPPSATARAPTSTNDSKLHRDHVRLQAEHARLQHRYEALADKHKAHLAKYDQERKTWIDCKNMIKRLVEERPEFRMACKDLQERMKGEEQLAEQALQPIAPASVNAPASAVKTGKRKRGEHDEKPASSMRAVRGSSSAQATPTKSPAQSGSRLTASNEPLRALRSPPKQSSSRKSGQANQSISKSIEQVLTTTPPRPTPTCHAAAPFSDISDMHMETIAKLERDATAVTSSAGRSNDWQSAADAYFNDAEVDADEVPENELEQEQEEVEALRPEEAESWSSTTREFLRPEEAVRQEEAEIADLLLRKGEKDAEMYEEDELSGGPSTSQALYVGLIEASPIASGEKAVPSPSGRQASMNAATGLACIYPMPQGAYAQVSPAKSVIDETIPPQMLRRAPKAQSANQSASKQIQTASTDRLKKEISLAPPTARRLFIDPASGKDELPRPVPKAEAASEIFTRRSASPSPSKGRIQERSEADDEETEQSSQPSSPPAREILAARSSVSDAAPILASRHERDRSASSRTMMPDSSRTMQADASSSGARAVPDESAKPVKPKDNSDLASYDLSQRLPAFARSAVYDEERDFPKRVLTNEKLPPRKSKQAQTQAASEEKVAKVMNKSPAKPLEESNIGGLISALRSTAANADLPNEGSQVARATQNYGLAQATSVRLTHAPAKANISVAEAPERSEGSQASQMTAPSQAASAMWHQPVAKMKKAAALKVKRTASAMANISGASLTGRPAPSQKAKPNTSQLAMPKSGGIIKSVPIAVVARPSAETEAVLKDKEGSAVRLLDLPTLLNVKAKAAEVSEGDRRDLPDPKPVDASVLRLQKTSAATPAAGPSSGTRKPRKSSPALAFPDTSAEEGKKGAKKKKRKGGIELPDDVENDLDAVARVIRQRKGTPGADDTPRPKALDVNKLLKQNEQKRNRESAGSSGLKRKLGMNDSADTPTAGSSKRTKPEAASEKARERSAQPEQERDYSEPYHGQDLLRQIHKQRKADLHQDPFKYKGKGAYADQLAGAMAAKGVERIEVNPDQNNGIPYVYQETVRGKEARKQLHAVDCDCCNGYYEAATKHLPLEQRAAAIEKLVNDTSRHRQQFEPAKTPPQYWQMGFPPSPQVEQIKREAEKMDEEKRKKMEAEARKCDGRFRYK